ncbi:MAG TPA: 3-oxoacyl-[acyl-carrier-protein] reductase [bacterium]|nr:3-oxoacyl-[acyl-carrier-protein] reductase [bacterium]
MYELENNTVIVTGGSRGIGYAIARAFAEHGASVVISSRTEEILTKAAAQIQSEISGADVTPIPGDISQADDAQHLIDATLEHHDTIDVLVNNAGITRDNILLRLKEKDWDDVLNTNLKGTFLCTKSVSRQMLKQRAGRIINISSVVGITGNAGQTNYGASKAGILGLTKSTAQELASRGITVNAIAPGYIETEMTENLTATQKEQLAARIPLGYIGQPDDVAGVAVFLASPAARYITGQVFRVDGGMVMS